MASPSQLFRVLRASRLPQLSRPFSSTPSIKADTASSALLADLTKPKTARPFAYGGMQSNSNNTDAFLKKWKERKEDRLRPSDTPDYLLQNQRMTQMQSGLKRRWRGGEVYAPHDLTPSEVRKWAKRATPSTDVFDELAMNPLREWKNPALMYEFQTTQGRIKKRTMTGLRPVNQRRIAKAIRRGIGMGFLPSVHGHPEILRRKGVKWTPM